MGEHSVPQSEHFTGFSKLLSGVVFLETTNEKGVLSDQSLFFCWAILVGGLTTWFCEGDSKAHFILCSNLGRTSSHGANLFDACLSGSGTLGDSSKPGRWIRGLVLEVFCPVTLQPCRLSLKQGGSAGQWFGSTRNGIFFLCCLVHASSQMPTPLYFLLCALFSEWHSISFSGVARPARRRVWVPARLRVGGSKAACVWGDRRGHRRFGLGGRRDL